MLKENKKLILYLTAIAFFKILLHFLLNNRYGLGRDEFYFISCAKRLAFGYIDHPPAIAFLAKIGLLLKDNSVFALRLSSVLAGGLTAFFVGVLTRLLGGKTKACVLASLVFVAMPVFLRMHTKFSISVFENLLMCCFFIVMAVLLKSRKAEFLIPLLTFAGIAFLFKYSILFWMGMMLLCVIFVQEYRVVLKSRYFFIGLIVFFLIVSPNILWQYLQGFPIVASFRNIDIYHGQSISYFSFILGQIFYLHPLGVLVSLLGVFWFLSVNKGWAYRLFVYAGAGVFLFLFLKKGKVYYTSPVFIPLIAAGSIYIMDKVKGRKQELFIFSLIVVMFVSAVPFSLPVLSENSYRKMVALFLPKKVGSLYGVQDDFSERQGWEELVAAVSDVYMSMDPDDKKKAYVFAAHYGIAGAFEYYADRYTLPPVICANNNFMLWYDGACNGDVVLMVGWQYRTLSKLYESVEFVEQADINSIGRQIYLCRKTKHAFNNIFRSFRHIGVY